MSKVLVSLGDSYTFGHGLVDPNPDMKLWKHESNKLSYTQKVCDKLKFDYCINAGWSGSSNSNLYYTLQTLYRKLDKQNEYFFIVGLTDYNRDTIFTKSYIHDNKHIMYDYSDTNWREHRKLSNKTWPGSSDIVKGLSDRTADDIIVYYNNKMSMILKTISSYYSIIDFFNANNLKFIMFDLMNVTSQKRVHNIVINEFLKNGQQHVMSLDTMYDLYYNDLKSNKVPFYLNQFNNNDFTNMRDYVNLFDNTKSDLKDDGHWNEKGHDICSDLLINWIKKTYEKDF